jgi:hypothetical protein
MLFGWTRGQLAIAKARHREHTCVDLPATIDAALDLITWWETMAYPLPGEVVFVDVPAPARDAQWALDVFRSGPRLARYLRQRGTALVSTRSCIRDAGLGD